MIIKDDRESQSMPRDLPALASKKLQLILENHDLELGTTFPPRTRSIKTRSNQFHSETNLNRLEDDNEVNLYIFYHQLSRQGAGPTKIGRNSRKKCISKFQVI